MKVIFNSRLHSFKNFSISSGNRAFCYGDGLFETIVTGPERLNLIHKHVDRLKRGCLVLGIEYPKELSVEKLNKYISELMSENGIHGTCRTRLTLWRSEGGLYSPERDSCSFLIESKSTDSIIYSGSQSIGFSQSFQLQRSPISFAKTTNALLYVLAGKERIEKNWDDIILTDSIGHLAETHIANLFWISQGQIFTPSLETGCIEGVLRSYFIDFQKKTGNPIIEAKSKPEILESATSIFTTNASGIKYFRNVAGIKKGFENPENLLTPFIKRLQQP